MTLKVSGSLGADWAAGGFYVAVLLFGMLCQRLLRAALAPCLIGAGVAVLFWICNL